MEGWTTVAEVRLKASDRGLELVHVSDRWSLIDLNDPGWIKEVVEVWGVRKKLRATLVRDRQDPNRTYIMVSDLVEAGELDYW